MNKFKGTNCENEVELVVWLGVYLAAIVGTASRVADNKGPKVHAVDVAHAAYCIAEASINHLKDTDVIETLVTMARSNQ